jgi:hypothetical protein
MSKIKGPPKDSPPAKQAKNPIDSGKDLIRSKTERFAAKKATKKRTQPAKKMGRPPEQVPQDIANEICAWIAAGETLRDYCRQEGKPAWQTVYGWLDKDEDFRKRFAYARELGEEAIAQECFAIADDGQNDWMEKHDKDGALVGWQINGEHVSRSKLRIETRLKLLAKFNPKKWGEKVDVNHGNQPENPLTVLLQQVSGTALPVVKNEDD